MKDKFCLLVCQNYLREVNTIMTGGGFEDVRLLSFPAWCGLQPMDWDDLTNSLSSIENQCDQVHVIGAGCLLGLGEPPLKFKNLHVHHLEQCFHMLVCKELVTGYTGRDAYLLSPGWLSRWRQYMETWKFDRATARQFFGESISSLVLLDTGVDPKSRKNLDDLASFLSLPADSLPVGLEFFRMYLTQIVQRWRLERQKEITLLAQKQQADYAMALDLTELLTQNDTEEQVVAKFLELFTTLFAPSILEYLPVKKGNPVDGIGTFNPSQVQFLMDVHGRQPSLDEGETFIVRIYHQDETIGFVHAGGFTFPENHAHYLNLAEMMADVCGLAITSLRIRRLLQEERDRAQSYLDVAAIIFVVIDPDQKVILANKKCAEILGYPEQEILGRYWFDNFIPERFRKETKADFARLMKGELELSESYENLVLTREGEERVIAWNNALIRNGQGEIIASLISGRDITEQRQLKMELEQILEDLKRSNSDLESFAYVVSHDLQEPLRMVTSYLGLLEQRNKGKLDEDSQEFIRYAVDGSNRMKILITGLLSYSRVGTRGSEFSTTNIEEVFSQALSNLKFVVEDSGAQVSHDPLPTLQADGNQLISLFQNLVGNAIKFRGDTIPEVHVGVKEDGNYWVFSVRDNGIGIDPKNSERIFVVFQRLHGRDEYPGTGIGLAICKRIIERHGGRIWVESQPGKGSTFYFTLPKNGGSTNEKQ